MLAASLASALAATHAYGQTDVEKLSPHAFELRNATPGITLTLQEMRRWMKGPKHGVDYRLGVSGLPKDKRFKLWQKNLGREPALAFFTVYLDGSGDVVFETAAEKFKEVRLSLYDFARGEPMEYALISTDQTMQAFARVVLFPIEARDGQCLLSVQLGSREGDLFLVMGEGFEPEEEVATESQSEGEVVKGRSRPSREGKFATVVAPAVVGRRSGRASFTASGKGCSPTVDYEWGPAALRKE